MYSKTGPQHDFHFAQVDCASNGDLCHQHEVKYYPSIFLYEDGKFKEEYTEKRSVEELARYVEGNWHELEEVKPEEINESGGEMDETRTRNRPRPVKGAEKARLPKLHLEEEEEDDEKKDLTEDENEEGGEQPYDVLLQDASSKVKAFLDPTTSYKVQLDDALETTTQTPSFDHPSPSDSPLETPPALPKFVAQQPESKRSAESEGSSLTYEWEKSRGDPDGTVRLLTKTDAERFKDQDAGPSFVKYFAPW
jgi:hypothetical protein